MWNFLFILIILNSAAFNEINSLSCMSYSNCNQSKLDGITTNGFFTPDLSFYVGNPCWQNIHSRSPNLVSKQCDNQKSAFCLVYSYTYTNYLTNSLLGYYYLTHGCYYISPASFSYFSENEKNSFNLIRYSNWSSWTGKNLPINISVKSLICNTSNCNSQAFGACITPELVQDFSSSVSHDLMTQVGDLTYLPVYQSCSSESSSLPTFKLSITLRLRVNQVFIPDYNNLNSAASLSFISNFTKFISTALNNNQPTSVVVTSLSSGSVVVNSQLVYNSSTLNSTSMTNLITSAVQTAAASSSSFPVIANSVSVSVSSSIANGTFKMEAHVSSYWIFILICLCFA